MPVLGEGYAEYERRVKESTRRVTLLTSRGEKYQERLKRHERVISDATGRTLNLGGRLPAEFAQASQELLEEWSRLNADQEWVAKEFQALKALR